MAAPPHTITNGERLFIGMVLLVLLLFSAGVGAYGISIGELTQLVFSPQIATDSTAHFVFWKLRLPRLLFALVVGAGLAISGATVQTIFRNPLADPTLIGVSSGCMLFAVLYIVFSHSFLAWTEGLGYQIGLALSAFVGGLCTTALVYGLAAHRQGPTAVAILLLAGVAVTAICAGGVGFLLYLADDRQMRDITFWNLGSLSRGNWMVLGLVSSITLISIVQLLRSAKELEILQLGDREAHYLGVETEWLKRKSIFWVCLTVGAGVAFTGLIGFVGLMVPHLVRLYCPGLGVRKLLLLSAALGAALLLVSDTLARTLFSPSELPIGILMAFIGGPFFLWLLYQQRQFIRY